MNEVSKICHLLGISSSDVLEAAGTKWNFLKFHPGLVGGHCIGVDPYYLTAKAEALGYRPEVILSGRRVNDGMGPYVGQQVVKLLAMHGHPIHDSRVGSSASPSRRMCRISATPRWSIFAASCNHSGLRPSFTTQGPMPIPSARVHGIELAPIEEFRDLTALIYAVPHDDYRSIEPAISQRIVEGGILVDIRAKLAAERLREDIHYWSL
jgi:UDP-N-acetyl-D-galactosamine dehydrogenase